MYKMKHIFFASCALLSASLLTGCIGFFDKDNTPKPSPLVVEYKPEVNPKLIWSTKAGSGVSDEYLRVGPTISGSAIYTAGLNGTITSVNKMNGQVNWQSNTRLPITTSPGVGQGIVVAGSRQGDVIALQASDGAIRWKVSVPGEILAAPAVGNNSVIVKAVDGYTRALSLQDGHELWSFQQVEPNLILRGSSAPLARYNDVLVGFANGNLAKLDGRNGQLIWMQSIAIPEGIFAIQRMIDIDADPIIYDHRIYAATYQGKISSLSWSSGSVLWSHDISSYTGMVADSNALYISDAKSHLWAFNADSGLVNWRQTDLEARVVSGPAVMGNYVVVGDGEGYLHWLSKRDGHYAGRQNAGAAIYAAPLAENGVLYAFTSKGYLMAYRL